MYIGTLHSICNRLLTDRRLRPGRKKGDSVKLIDAVEQYFFVKRNSNWGRLMESIGCTVDDCTWVNDFFQKSKATYPNKHNAVRACIALFNRFSEERIDPIQAIEQLDLTEADDLYWMLSLYKEYLDLLADQRPEYCDLALIQEKALQLVETNPDAKNVFKHVIVDEYQDTNHIQEQLYFALAGQGNICVVGDDDQALYRFRGSTVENFVDFPDRVDKYLGLGTTKIALATNYRSRRNIVDFYTGFIEKEDWRKNGSLENQYRVHDKQITAFSSDDSPAVVTTDGEGNWHDQVANLCGELIEEKIVQDPNQIAFLFPSLKNKATTAMIKALQEKGINVYAPRAGNFLDQEEPRAVFGVLAHLFGAEPDPRALKSVEKKLEENKKNFSNWEAFNKWLANCVELVDDLCEEDSDLKRYIKARQNEIELALKDYKVLLKTAKKRGWELDQVYDVDGMNRSFAESGGLSQKAKKALGSGYLHKEIKRRVQDENAKPYVVNQVLTRVTSLDWNLLDIFWQISGFKHFKRFFDEAEKGNEAHICNMSKVSEYLDALHGNVLVPHHCRPLDGTKSLPACSFPVFCTECTDWGTRNMRMMRSPSRKAMSLS